MCFDWCLQQKKQKECFKQTRKNGGHLFTRAYVGYQYATAICNQKYCNSKREMRLSSSVKAMRMYLPLFKDLYLQLWHELWSVGIWCFSFTCRFPQRKFKQFGAFIGTADWLPSICDVTSTWTRAPFHHFKNSNLHHECIKRLLYQEKFFSCSTNFYFHFFKLF